MLYCGTAYKDLLVVVWFIVIFIYTLHVISVLSLYVVVLWNSGCVILVFLSFFSASCVKVAEIFEAMMAKFTVDSAWSA